MEQQGGSEFIELICDEGTTTPVLYGVINLPAAVTFCGVLTTWDSSVQDA